MLRLRCGLSFWVLFSFLMELDCINTCRLFKRSTNCEMLKLFRREKESERNKVFFCNSKQIFARGMIKTFSEHELKALWSAQIYPKAPEGADSPEMDAPGLVLRFQKRPKSPKLLNPSHVAKLFMHIRDTTTAMEIFACAAGNFNYFINSSQSSWWHGRSIPEHNVLATTSGTRFKGKRCQHLVAPDEITIWANTMTVIKFSMKAHKAAYRSASKPNLEAPSTDQPPSQAFSQ